MATKTSVSSQDFTTILKQYDLGEYVQATPISAGTVQTNYILITSQGKFVWRYYENRSPQSVLFEMDVLTYLQEQRYPCPAPIQNRQHQYLGLYQEKPYVLFEFIEGQAIDTPNEQQKQQVIHKIAELHQLTVNFQSPHTLERWNYNPALCRKLAQAEAAKINTLDAHQKLAWLIDMLTTLELPMALPQGVCHCDLDPSNIFFDGDELVALLDFDDANYTFLLFDLVALMEYWAWPHTAEMLNLTIAADIVQAYAQHRPLTALEQRHLYDVYKLSILIDCIWFFGRGTAEDFYEKRKIEALTKLGRAQFVEALFG